MLHPLNYSLFQITDVKEFVDFFCYVHSEQEDYMQLSHYFLSNGGLVGGVIREIDCFCFFSQILALDSGRKISCLLQKCKIMYKNIVLSFFKQN